MARDFSLPELGEGVYEAELVSWKVKPGDAVQPGQDLLEALTDKATMEVPSPFQGTITKLLAEEGQTIKVGQAILSYDDGGSPAKAEAKEKAPPVKEKTTGPVPAVPPARPGAPRPEDGQREKALPVKASPSVRMMARKLGIDIGQVHGSGPQGRILVEDLGRHLPSPENQPYPSTEPGPDFGTPGTRIKLLGLRRKIAEHMVQAKKVIPHYSYVDECDVTDLVRTRESLREPFQRAGVKLTYLPFFIQAAIGALKEVPIVNAFLDEAAGEIVLHDHYHIGIAVAAPAGLIVPVIHDADKKNLVELAREVERLSGLARTGKVGREDLSGGTFTITSIGNIGGLFATPIIHHPEVGILGIGKIVKRPIYDTAGQVRPADMVYLSFSFDHRVLDGAVGAAFGNALIRRLQNPATMLVKM